MTAVLANLKDQIKRSASALVTQILIESAKRGDSKCGTISINCHSKERLSKRKLLNGN
jgi:hypothetical protein